MPQMSIQGRLKEVRKRTGYNQIPFARELGVSQSAFANYERGATDIPINLAIKICKDFKISAAWFFLGHGSMEDENVGEIVEDAVIAMRTFSETLEFEISKEKEAKLVRFLFEEMMCGQVLDAETQERFLKAATWGAQ